MQDQQLIPLGLTAGPEKKNSQTRYNEAIPFHSISPETEKNFFH
jgi:hypothetical protein